MDQITKQIGELHPKNEDKQDLSVFLGTVDIHILEFRVSSFKFQHLLKCTSFIIVPEPQTRKQLQHRSTKKNFFVQLFHRIHDKLKWLMHHPVEHWSHIALQERVTVKRGAPSPGNTKPPSTALMSYKVTHRPKSFSTCFPTPKPLQKPQSSFNITKTYAPIASKELDRKTLNKSR